MPDEPFSPVFLLVSARPDAGSAVRGIVRKLTVNWS